MVPSPTHPFFHSSIHANANATSLYVYNKIDSISLDFLDQLAREPHTAVMSCELDLGVHDVVERIWTELRLIRVYTKRYPLPSPPSSNSPCYKIPGY
jgi:ribosome-interacting GTPase 1